MPRLSLLVLLTISAALAPTALAQRAPSGGAVLSAWQRGQAAAARGVESVAVFEETERRLAGPRGVTTIETRASVVHRAGGPPERHVERVRVNGRTVPADHLDRLDERLGRAFGPTTARLATPPMLPVRALAEARADGPAVADRVGRVRAWRVALQLPPPPADRRGPAPDRPASALVVTAWFSQDDEPRLLRAHFAYDSRRGTVVRTVDSERADGLDVPTRAESRAEVRQTRRLREYATTVQVTATYGRPVVARR